MKIASYKRTKEIIDQYNFILKKNYGQNFLIDDHVLNKIITSADITEKDVIIEIGPGIGSVTEALAEHAYKVIAVEIDTRLIPILETHVVAQHPNVEIINEDILKVDMAKIFADYSDYNIKVVANLPYYITTPIVMRFLEEGYKPKSITVMVQKEVCTRMNAKPGTKDYGTISLAVQYYSAPYLVANVPRNCFLPKPNVDSAVIQLQVLPQPSVTVSDTTLLFQLIKVAFSLRRKTLVNCLFHAQLGAWTKPQYEALLTRAGLSPNVRGEALALEDFAALTEVLIHAKEETW